MALIELPGGMLLPPMHRVLAGTGSQVVQLTAAGHIFAAVIRVPETGTLNRFVFRTGTNLLDGTSVIRMSLQDVNPASGDPDGVVDEYRDVASASLPSDTWIVPGLMTDNGLDGGNKRAVTQGDLLVCAIGYQTFVAADQLEVSNNGAIGISATVGGLSITFPYITENTGGAYAKRNYPLQIALEYSDGSFYTLGPDVMPATIGSQGFHSGSTPDEIGIKFSLPFPLRVSGAWARLEVLNPCDIVLYDSDGVGVLNTLSIDPDIRFASPDHGFWLWPQSINLNANESYRIVVKPTTGAPVNLRYFTVPGLAYMGAIPGGTDFVWTSRTNGGAWSDDTVKRPFMGLYATHFESAVPFISSGRGFMRGMVR